MLRLPTRVLPFSGEERNPIIPPRVRAAVLVNHTPWSLQSDSPGAATCAIAFTVSVVPSKVALSFTAPGEIGYVPSTYRFPFPLVHLRLLRKHCYPAGHLQQKV